MHTLTYPSAITPAPPQVQIAVPDGWEQLDLPQTLIAARETNSAEQFASNMTVRHLIRPVNVTGAELIAELGNFIAGKDGGVLSEPFQRMIHGVEIHGTSLAYIDSAAGTLAQVHVFARRPDGERASIVQLVITFSGARADSLRPVAREIVRSLFIGWPEPSSGEGGSAGDDRS